IATKPAIMAETDQYVAFARSTAPSPISPASKMPRSGSPNPPLPTSGAIKMQTIDLQTESIRDLNQKLHDQIGQTNQTQWEILNPRGQHAIACGIAGPLDVTIKGSTGYYTASMNKEATVRIEGSAGPGLAQNMMSGTVIVEGDASQ